VLRIGDIHLASVNGEVYSEIAMRLKGEAPASQTIVVTLANASRIPATSIRTRRIVTSRFK
jgi:hypothetical protein